MDPLLHPRRAASEERMLMASHLHCQGRAVLPGRGDFGVTASLLLRGEFKR
jgi:hypothetical protein